MAAGVEAEKMKEAIQENVVPIGDHPGALVTAFVLIVEYMLPDGRKCIVRLNDQGMTRWDVRGMLHEALFGNGWEGE